MQQGLQPSFRPSRSSTIALHLAACPRQPSALQPAIERRGAGVGVGVGQVFVALCQAARFAPTLSAWCAFVCCRGAREMVIE